MPQATARISLPARYRLVRHVANGGMASVWEAQDELLDRPVAIKVLATHLSEDERARRRFAREARTAGGLSAHPHVVTVYDVAEHDGRAFIVMELLRGGTVADRIKSGRRIDRAQALEWLRDAADALDAAHAAGIVHRDVKPGNLLLDSQSRLAIADFGIARLALEDQITQTGQVLGTAAYIAPEQAMGAPATPASDRYSLAVVAFELLTGSKPFRAEGFAAQARAHVDEPPPPASIRDHRLPAAVDAVLDRGLAKAPEDRWPTATAMVQALDDALGEDRTAPTRPLPTDPEARRAAAAAAPLARRATRSDGGGAAPPRGRRGAAPPPPSPPPDAAGGRRRGPVLLAALVAFVALCGGAAALLLGGGGGDGASPQRDRARAEATRTAKPERSRTPEPTAEATRTAEPTSTPTPTPTATPSPEPTATPAPTQAPASGGGRGSDPTALQLRAYALNNAGDGRGALPFARKAVRLCEGSDAVSPCAYALYEYARALRLSGDPQGAIAALEERRQRFPDNQPDAVEQELARARAAAG